jgi:hypothetical protein
MSDMAGYAASVAVERSGSCRDTMEPRGASDIDGETERSIQGEHMSHSVESERVLIEEKDSEPPSSKTTTWKVAKRRWDSCNLDSRAA